MIIGTAAALLFDMDGTLISSVAATERVWGRWAARQGLDVSSFLRGMHGVRAIDTIGGLGLPGLDPAVEAAEIARQEIDDVDGIVPIAGSLEFLSALPPERWAIVTSAPRALATVRLRAAGVSLPPTLVTAEDVQRGKPAPDGYRLAAERLGVETRNCIVFEDAAAGVAAAEAANALAVVIVEGAGAPHLTKSRHQTILSYDDLAVAIGAEGITLRTMRD